MTDAASADATLAHRNLVTYSRWVAGLEAGAAVHDADGVLAVAMATDYPSFRQAVARDDGTPADRWAEAGHRFLSGRGSTACLFVRNDADDGALPLLADHGYAEYGRVPSMLCDAVPEERAPAPGTTVRLADSPEDVLAYAAVAGRAFVDIGLLEEPTRALLASPDHLLGDDVVLAVGEVDGRIVAGAFTLLLAGGTSGYVSYVSVLPEARGQALGDAVTRRITREAFERGATSLSLEASTFGANTYRRMGYRDLFEYRLMIWLGGSTD